VGGAAFSRAPSEEEVVRLESGTLELDVGPAPPGRRFRILTDDAVVESAESRLSVEAEGNMLVAVRVFAGYAEVRARGVHASLRAGDEWVHEGPPAAAESAVVVPSPPSTGAGRAPRPASFERAWRLLNAGRAAEAADAFRDVEAQSRGDAIAEDALFWCGVSLERAGKPADARAVLLRFTSRFPHSERSGEASAMLGWILLEAGDTDEARRAFERAENDKVDRVRASARSGLARLGR
jgi:TolA-binding protein